MHCRTCGEADLERVRRKGFLRRRIFPWFGFYPWLCQACGAVHLYRARSVGEQAARALRV